MSHKHAVHLATCTATMAFALALALPAFVDIPLPWYLPYEHRWVFAVHVGGIAMDFFGRCLFATLASCSAGTLAYAFARRRRSEPSGRTVALFTTWAISLTLLVATFYVWRVEHRAPTAACTATGDRLQTGR